MLDLLAGVLLTVSLFVSFKYFSVLKIDSFQAIVYNYVTCVVTGCIFSGIPDMGGLAADSSEKLLVALTLGCLFIFTFNLMGLTTRRIGIGTATIANKISIVIPVLSGIFIIQTAKSFDTAQLAGMLLTPAAIVLSSYKKNRTGETTQSPFLRLVLPFTVFIFGGIIDSLVNYANHALLSPGDEAAFVTTSFVSAAAVGSLILLIQTVGRKRRFQGKALTGGIILGVLNFFSIWFLMRALAFFSNDGAFFFPVFNILTILASILFAFMLFRERPTKINLAGILVALASIFLIAHKEIIEYFRNMSL